MAEPLGLGSGRPLRLAVISLHASPLAPLGRGGDGGLNVYVQEVCRAFSERGVATDVFTLGGAEADIGRLARLSRVIPVPQPGGARDKYSLVDAVPGFARHVESWWRRSPYDLVYSHYWLSGAAAAWLRDQFDVPWVHTAHTLGLVKNRALAAGARPEPDFRIRIEEHIARRADLLVASTAAERGDLISLYGASAGHVAVVPPGVDHSRFVPRTGVGHYLLFAGRLERLKGVETAIRAFGLVASGEPGLELIVLGDDSEGGDERSRLGRLAADLGLAARVKFLGPVPQADLPRWYAGALACLVPSYSESFGLVALEAQACGVPVLAADLPGLASIVRDGVTGYVVPGDDPAAYARRLQELLADPELAQQMGRRATLLAQRFSWSRTAERLLGAMTALIPAQVGLQAGARHE